jgi:hypothetical protein
MMFQRLTVVCLSLLLSAFVAHGTYAREKFEEDSFIVFVVNDSLTELTLYTLFTLSCPAVLYEPALCVSVIYI